MKSGDLGEFLSSGSVPEPNSGCVLWLRAVSSTGYGSLDPAWGYSSTHRAAWAVANGPIPAGMCVLHRCDVRSCINPAHLFLGTKHDNAVDMANKRRANGQAKTHCPRGHLYDGWNVIRHPRGQHGRICRECHSLFSRARYEADKERITARNKAYAEAHREQRRAAERDRYHRNKSRTAR